ncbi:MAG: DegV family protein [Enterococcus sp.]
MTKIKIVTDSSATMPKELLQQLDIHVVPLTVMIDGILYADDDQLSGAAFMELMAQAKELPKTSQPPIGQFVELYDELGRDGSQILSIHMTQALSGTVEAARQASQLSKSQVTVIDSDVTDQGLSFQVIKAAQLALANEELATILTEIKKIREQTKLFIGVSTLDNLVKGGRISRAKGVLSNLLNMRVVMELKNTELLPIVKGRGMKTFTNWFQTLKVELQQHPEIHQIGISHADGLEIATSFKNELQALFPEKEIWVLQTTPVIATHTGKNAFAILYY